MNGDIHRLFFCNALWYTVYKCIFKENNRAVMTAYGFIRKGENGKYTTFTESEYMPELMKMYQKLVEEK